jgi:hypothetical protein
MINWITYEHCNPLQGQYSISTKGKSCSLAGIPVMKTGFSLLEILHRENPVFITGMGLQCRPTYILPIYTKL